MGEPFSLLPGEELQFEVLSTTSLAYSGKLFAYVGGSPTGHLDIPTYLGDHQIRVRFVSQRLGAGPWSNTVAFSVVP